MVNIGTVWPGWEIEELIGQGAYGKVYRIKKTELGDEYKAALKIIEIPSDEAEVQSLMNMGMDVLSIRNYFEGTARNITNEIRIMESLKSAGNIVHVEEHTLIPHEEGIGWTILIRMELLESLRNYETRAGMPDVKETVKIGKDICQALTCCEEKQIIHRDIKPENIFRNEFGMYKLGDFGIARQMENTKSAYSQKGTSGYMAPEVNRGERYDNTVDIYSLGIMLYRFLNKQRMPFLPTNTNQIGPNDIQKAQMRRLMGEDLPAPCDADPALAAIILKAANANPTRRYRNAEKFRKALEDWENGKATESVDPVSKTQAAPAHWNAGAAPEIQTTIGKTVPVPQTSPQSYVQPVKQPQPAQNDRQPAQQPQPAQNAQSFSNQADAGAHRAAAAVQQAQQPVQHWSQTAQRPGFAQSSTFTQPVFEQKPPVMPAYSSVPQKEQPKVKPEQEPAAREEPVRDDTPYFSMMTMVRIVMMTFFVMLMLSNLFSLHEMRRFFYGLYIKYGMWFLAITSGLAGIPLTLAIEFLFEYLIRNVKRKDGTAYSMKPHRLKYLAIVGAVGMAACAAGFYLIVRNALKLATKSIFGDLLRNPDAFMFSMYGIIMMALIISMLIINGRKRHD